MRRQRRRLSAALVLFPDRLSDAARVAERVHRDDNIAHVRVHNLLLKAIFEQVEDGVLGQLLREAREGGRR